MNKKNGIETKITKNSEEINNVFIKFSSYFQGTLSKEESRKEYINKILKYGVFVICYCDEEIAGFYCGYANDKIERRAYGALFAISKEMGMIRGLVFKELLFCFTNYAIANGMETMVGEVYDDNTNAKKQYKLLGFENIGRASNKSEYIKVNLKHLLNKLV